MEFHFRAKRADGMSILCHTVETGKKLKGISRRRILRFRRMAMGCPGLAYIGRSTEKTGFRFHPRLPGDHMWTWDSGTGDYTDFLYGPERSGMQNAVLAWAFLREGRWQAWD